MENNKDNKKDSSMFTYKHPYVSEAVPVLVIILVFLVPTVLIVYDAMKDSVQNKSTIFLAIIVALLPLLLITGIIEFIINRSIKAGKKENMSKIDFQKEKGLYRDILKKYTPAVLSYIDDYTIEPKTDIPAIILMLEMKGKIEIINNKIKVINLNSDDLGQSERYILKSINNGKVKIENLSEFKLVIREEAKSSGLIKSFDKEMEKIQNLFVVKAILKKLGTVFAFCGILVVIILIINFLIKQGIISEIIGVYAVLFFLVFIPIFNMSRNIFFSSKNVTKTFIGKRTDEGERLNEKVEGLKNYIMNYTLLSEREKKELVIWEEYLVYSVLFGINVNVIEELSKVIEVKY